VTTQAIRSFEDYAVGWTHRRWTRTGLTTIVVGASIILHVGNRDFVDWVVLAMVLIIASYDVLVSAPRELDALAGAPSSKYIAFTAREVTFLRWAEFIAYLTALAVIVHWRHRPPRDIDEVAIVVFIAVGLFLRLGLRPQAKKSGAQLLKCAPAPDRTAP
jgi:hypothetical protein